MDLRKPDTESGSLSDASTSHILGHLTHACSRTHFCDCVRHRHHLGGAARCFRDSRASPAGAAEFQADGLFLSADLDSVAMDCAAHQESFAAAEFSGVLWAPLANFTAWFLGFEPDSWVCLDSVRHWRPRTAQRRAT